MSRPARLPTRRHAVYLRWSRARGSSMVIFRRKCFNVFNVLLRACDGPLGSSTCHRHNLGFCDGRTAVCCDGGTAFCCCRIPTKAICLLLAGARAIQSALMMTTTAAAVLVCIFARLKPLPAFEPSAFSPSGKFWHSETPRSAVVHLTRRSFGAAWSASGVLVSFPVGVGHLCVATVLGSQRRLRLA
jgi:hypothetical protein